MKKTTLLAAAFATVLGFSGVVNAADYQVDVRGAHAFVNFKIKHLGYSWLYGRFNKFDGKFTWDESNPNGSNINIEIDTASIDSNHAERDKHLRNKDFLNVSKYPTSTFNSTKIKFDDKTHGVVTGEFTLHGVTKTISFPIEKLGEGKDPWGGYRAGFVGTTQIKLSDYGIEYNLGPASTHVELELAIEGIRL
ncbi:YceI family protein [Shewanella sp. 202IG2-18]|uniref:YceI family protein n=1 Tax=Parashewanella hymeniacidonis TaxID=2807618 RepID=UPI00196077B8|nr:YceI family protein [Parashewanella hymeniacidonis]MBM7072562.1 YceI family protein [Parashewanella hymeniacidonis]